MRSYSSNLVSVYNVSLLLSLQLSLVCLLAFGVDVFLLLIMCGYMYYFAGYCWELFEK